GVSVELDVVFDIGRHQTDDLACEGDDLSRLIPILAKISVNRLREDLQGLLAVWNRSGSGITSAGCRVRSHLSHSYLLLGGRAPMKHGACQHVSKVKSLKLLEISWRRGGGSV